MLALASAAGAGRPAVGGLVLPPSGVFALAYVHSVYRAPSAEVFTARGGRFTMRAVVSASGGVLDYYALEGTRGRTPDGDWVLRLAVPATYEELPVIATPIGRRTLVAGGRCLPLHPASGARELRLTVRLVLRDRGGPCPPHSWLAAFGGRLRAADASALTTSPVS
ncbi:DUF1850 domain-containing protein [Nonomuraea sp. NPDC005501]|uniref:DUF1850 domain-containing protein n=1 Tax=Nonomuraea sp. NPDC005501 TaxID=3156884 RepID=UPI0033A102E6